MTEQILKAVIRFDGAGFAGWQVQPGLRTVQGALEEALAAIAPRPVSAIGASRTDAGVHAFGQVCSFAWPRAAMAPDRLAHALSRMLRPDIRVERIEPAPEGFHARYDAKWKRYAYTLDLNRHADPFAARYAWHVPYELDADSLESLARPLWGAHDFAGYQGGGAKVKTTTRTLFDIRLRQGGVVRPDDAGSGLVRLEFRGTGFLYKMVRNITGTLVDAARGAVPPETVLERLGSTGPYKGFTAPGHGLTLCAVHYDSDAPGGC